MPTVIFVHGISVRSASLVKCLAECEERLSRWFGGWAMKFVCWGDFLGTPYHPELKSIPSFFDRGGEYHERDEENQTAVWALLYRDPLFELRLLNSQGPTQGPGGLGVLPPGQELEQKLQGFTASSKLNDLLINAGLSQVFDAAKASLMSSAEFAETRTRAGRPLTPYRQAIARAILAVSVTAAFQHDEFPPFCLHRDLRDGIVAELVECLGGLEGALPPWLLKKFLNIAMGQVASNFGKLAQDNYRLIGDILRYQSRGDEIRAAIRGELAIAEPPVLILGHSLGGIASFETLYEDASNGGSPHLEKVKLLATVGSQVPFFYECDALAALRFGGAEKKHGLPERFPPWLNVYDSADLLSFVAEPLFAPVSDVRIDAGQPFPIAHSAYFGQDALWQTLRNKLL